ncbi:HAD family hydrolase [Anaeromicropila herbilytica]|uniref:Haloacid dehalogenase n=1 Tax=Anaeromicropila herbilytica TaxID=2785025 RepID=A0A7R7EHK7_9FIRM|nr:HAD family hydrolase [Anaeromicropila herbilytica]BCN28875.1 haloacid dehalogenase [Anaeromicropila herbilytica]
MNASCSHLYNIMNTLYISDLDGTLLQPNAKLSPSTIQTINELMQKGMNFTCATARTYASTNKLLEPLNIRLPLVLMNGACVYNKGLNRYEKIEYLDKDTIKVILDFLKETNMTGFLYEIKDNTLCTYYEDLDSKGRKDFHDERVNLFQKRFVKVEDFSELDPTHILYFCLIDTEEKTKELYELLSDEPSLKLERYTDIYSKDLWYLEIFSVNASKYNAVQYLRKQYEFDQIIGFGDNLNDLALFKACEECYAVANAKEDVKKAATKVIDYNYNDGVANFLKNHYTS